MKPPTQTQLTRMLRYLNEGLKHPDAGGEFFGLRFDEYEQAWVLSCEFGREYGWKIYGREYVPGADKYDAVAAARRLLAAVRDAGSIKK
jgi:hypothetical protein